MSVEATTLDLTIESKYSKKQTVVFNLGIFQFDDFVESLSDYCQAYAAKSSYGHDRFKKRFLLKLDNQISKVLRSLNSEGDYRGWIRFIDYSKIQNLMNSVDKLQEQQNDDELLIDILTEVVALFDQMSRSDLPSHLKTKVQRVSDYMKSHIRKISFDLSRGMDDYISYPVPAK